jgi:hypothetical protein
MHQSGDLSQIAGEGGLLKFASKRGWSITKTVLFLKYARYLIELKLVRVTAKKAS